MPTFYSISNWQSSDEEIITNVLLDVSHDLFKGHFPKMPILPGACMVQLTHHLVERHLRQTCRFVKATNIKFLLPINPMHDPVLESRLKISHQSENIVQVEQLLTNGKKTFFKFSAFYQKA